VKLARCACGRPQPSKITIEGIGGGEVSAYYDPEAGSWYYKTHTGSGGAIRTAAEVMYWAGYWDGRRAQSSDVAAVLSPERP